MKKEFNLCNLYMLCGLLSAYQSISGNSNRIIMLGTFAVMVFITLYCLKRLLSTNQAKGSIGTWVLLWFLLLLYGTIAAIFGGITILKSGETIKATQFVTMVFTSVGSLFTFYYFSLRGYITKNHLIIWLYVFMVVSTFDYFAYEVKRVNMLSQFATFDEITNNVAYSFVGLLPFVFLLNKKPIMQYAIIAYLVYFTVIGMKRGAIIIGFLMLAWFVLNATRNMKNSRRFLIIALTIVGVIVGWMFISRFYESSDYFRYRIEVTRSGATGRESIHSKLLDCYLTNYNVLEFLFGGGAYHTYAVAGNDAHNDWLELLIDCGLVGFVIYLIYWIRFIIEWLSIKKEKLVYCIMGSCFIYTFLRTFFSMSFGDLPLHFSMILGWCFSQVRLKRIEATNRNKDV